MIQRAWRLVAALAAGLGAAACTTISPPAPAASESYANFLVGRVADLRDDHEAASDRYYGALEHAPDDPELIAGALSSALATGDIERARLVTRIASMHRANPPGAYLVRGVEDMSAGRWRQAREDLTRVRGSAAEELTERVLVSWARIGEGRVEDVVNETGRIDATRPYAGLFIYQHAMALDAAGRIEEARAAYEAAEQTGIFLPPAIERHADLLARAGARDEARALLVRRRNANYVNPALLAAAARLDAGEAAAAEPLTPARGAAIGLYGLAAIFLQDSDSGAGLATLTLATMLDSKLDAARLTFAETLVELRRGPQARAALNSIPASSAYSETARVMEAWILVQEDRGEDAIALARETAETGGPRSRRALADIYRSLDRFAEAEPLYTQLIDAQPNEPDWRLHFARGIARERLDRWPEAEADLQRALQISPDQAEVLNYLGYTWVDRGERMEEAMALIQRAVEIRPLSGAIVDSLGWAYYRQGDYEQALEYLERAVELEPADTVLNDHLGDVYWRLGRRTEARFQWRRALSLDPSETERAAIEPKLVRGLPPAPRTRSATR